jgi:hypothetical protein
MARRHERGQASLTTIAIVVGLVVAGVWIWKRLPPETQELVIDQAVPMAAGALIVGLIVVAVAWKITLRVRQRRERDRLIAAFQRETAEQKLELSFALMECNAYRIAGLEEIAPALKELWSMTLQRALGDERHRVRGMAASHLGVLQDKSVVPLLIKALEDDHSYVRACAALGLGRLQATEARERLAQVAKEDGDQTVRSRAREALDQLR